MRKLFTIFLLLVIFNINARAQVTFDNIKYNDLLTSKTLGVLVDDKTSDYAKYLDYMFGKYWKLTPYEIIEEKNFKDLRKTNKYAFLRTYKETVQLTRGFVPVSDANEVATIMDGFAYKDGSSGEKSLFQIYSHSMLENNQLPFLKSSLTIVQEGLKNGYDMEDQNYNLNKGLISQLKNDTLYVYNPVFNNNANVNRKSTSVRLYGIKIAGGNDVKLNEEELNKERNRFKEAFKDYPYPYRFINIAELTDLAEHTEKPLYLFNTAYLSANRRVYKYVTDVTSGKIIFKGDKSMMYWFRIKKDDIDDISDAIKKAPNTTASK